MAEHFDAIWYIDVLEHIEDDRAEVARAAVRLNPCGHLIVPSPGRPTLETWLEQNYSPSDQHAVNIAGYRLYRRTALH